jgi:dGTPase
MALEERALKSFLYANMYRSRPVGIVQAEAMKVVAGLFRVYRDDPSLLPEDWLDGEEGSAAIRRIGDFIAGMTDRYAIRQYRALIGPVELPEAF